MAKRKHRPKKFSVVSAVKANARARLGQPKPERVIQDHPGSGSRKQKHKETMQKLMAAE